MTGCRSCLRASMRAIRTHICCGTKLRAWGVSLRNLHVRWDTNMGMPINEATVFLGQRNDRYLTLPVSILESLNVLQLDGVTLQFRKPVLGDREVLMRSRTRTDMRRKAGWQYVEDKDARRIVRYVDRGITHVEWL